MIDAQTEKNAQKFYEDGLLSRANDYACYVPWILDLKDAKIIDKMRRHSKTREQILEALWKAAEGR